MNQPIERNSDRELERRNDAPPEYPRPSLRWNDVLLGGAFVFVCWAALHRDELFSKPFDLRATFTSCSAANTETRAAAQEMIRVANSEGDERSALVARTVGGIRAEDAWARLAEFDEPAPRMTSAVGARYETLKAAVRFEDRACGRRPRLQVLTVPSH